MNINGRDYYADVPQIKHHQPDTERRADGNLYAACGLVFRDFKHILFDGDPGEADIFEREYIIPVEIADNGGTENPLSLAVSAFNNIHCLITEADLIGS